MYVYVYHCSPVGISRHTPIPYPSLTVIRGYGTLVIDLCAVVPDGLACFFVSYEFLETAVSAWEQQVCV